MWKEKMQEIKRLDELYGEEINDGATEIRSFLEKIGESSDS